MKRTLSVLIAAVMLMSIMFAYPVSAAKADAKITLKQAIEIAKETFKFDSTGYDFNSGYNEGNDGVRSWGLNWNSKAGNGSGINVSVDADTGEIISYNQWEPYTQPTSRIPKYSRDAALQAAKELAQKLQPEKFKSTKLFEPEMNTYGYYDSFNMDTYNFVFMRQVNGVEFSDNGIYVNVDKNTLKIRYFNVNWERNGLPDMSKAITKEAAKKIFEEKLGIELSYYIVYPQNNNNQPKVMLVYSPKNGSRPIDALTGEVLNYTYYGPMYDKVAMGAGAPAQASVTPQEQKEIDASSKYLSKDKAIEVVKKYINIDEEKFVLSYANLYAGYGQENATWNFSWGLKDVKEKRYAYISAAVDAVTGELRNFYMNDSDNEQPAKDSQPKYTKDQAREIGEKYLKEINPDKFAASEYRAYLNDYEDSQVKPVVYNFSYVRKANGIPVPSNTMNVTVNIYTGQVVGYNYYWNNVDFPSADGAMTLADAYSKYYSRNDLTLRYARYYDYNKYGDRSMVKLLYSVKDNNGLMDAKTGMLVDYNGNPIQDVKKTAFSDIKGSKYENDIKLLAEMGILDTTTDKYNPDGVMLQKDFIKMLVKATQPYVYPMYAGTSQSNDYDFYYEQAIQKKIISAKEKKPDAQITRQDAARMLVKLLGVGFVADMNNIYVINFKDANSIKADCKGYAVIASALGIVTADKGNFNPNGKVTRGEAASLLIKALKVDTNPKE